MYRTIALSLLLAAALMGQTVTGSITGSVTDSSGLAVAGAKVTVTNTATGDRYEMLSAASGDFVVNSVQPGNYTLAVEATGFKRHEAKDLNLTQAERLSAGKIVLQLGSVTESITVDASGTAVDVESNDRSQSLSAEQMDRLQSRGRNYLELLNTLPGAIGDERFFGTDAAQSTLTPNFSGLSNMYNSVFVDGASASSPVNPQYSTTNVSMDSVGEVKVMQTNYRAEDGRNGGAVIKTFIKSGTRAFHGSVYDYERNEFFNSNFYFNNLNGIARPRYRYHTFGGSLGGPITLGKHFNRNREKLFFFFGGEISPTVSPGQQSIVQVTMPTALERTGDFSQTVDQNNRVVSIWDPQNNRVAFPGNIVPKSRINAAGQALLNLFPAPNFFDRTISRGNYNYNFMESASHVTSSYTTKIDYNANTKIRAFFRGTLWRQDDKSYRNSGQAWEMLKSHYQERFRTASLGISYTVNPSTVNELNIGLRGSPNWSSPEDPLSKIQRATLGAKLGQFFPANNPNNLLPAMSFGGVPGAASFGGNTLVNLGLKSTEPLISLTDNVTKVLGPHTFKAGFFFEHLRNVSPSTGNFAGSVDFTRDSVNALDTNWAYSNALLGTYRTYSETDSRPRYDLRAIGVEWFLQDTWKARRRLTIDYGIRFSCFTPYAQANQQSRNFLPSLYDPKKRVTLYRPALDSTGARVAQNPLNGVFYPALYIGAIVPGSGDPYNGTVLQTDSGTPSGFVKNHGPLMGPRFGFAYDVTGDGKTAIRGGIGVSYQLRANLDYPQQTVNNTQNSFTNYYGSLDSLASVSGVLFPRALRGLEPDAKSPTVYSYSLGVQRAIGFGAVLDVAYVGNQVRQVPLRNTNYNTLPFGTRFLASSMDPTRASTRSALPDDFLRPYVGYSTITMPGFTTTNYNSLQTSVQRRFKKGLQFGGSWTWSKSMGYYESYAQYFNNRLNYGKLAIDRTHTLSITYLYDVPKASKLLPNGAFKQVVKHVLDNWQGSGVNSFASGRPWNVSYSMTSGPDITGGGDYNRVIVTGDPRVSRLDRTFYRFFNTDAFAAPLQAVGSVAPGNAPLDNIRGPGRNNWDMTFSKTIPVWEGKRLQFRWELYNIFNHASFYQLDTAARFDAATYKQVNTRLGQITNSLTPRVMQLSLRLNF